MSLTPTQLFAVLTPTQQLSATLHETGPAGPPGPAGPAGADGPPGADGLPHIIQDEGVALASFDTLNFAGAGVTASVDTPGARITVTIPGGSQTPWTSDIDGGGHNLTNVAGVIPTAYVLAPICYGQSYVQSGFASDTAVLHPTGLQFNSSAGVIRWFLERGGAESGGNAGSDFVLQRFSDAGASLGIPLQINRATGAIQMFLGGTLKTLSVDGSGFVKAA